MTLELTTIVSMTARPEVRLEQPSRVHLTPSIPSRRSFLKGVASLGAAAGLFTLNVFPMVRQARADGWDIYGACPSYAAGHNCSPGCGPSPVGANACQPPGQPHTGYHRANGDTYILRPNQCYSGTYDGWLWQYSNSCGDCRTSITYRCHDGYTKSGGSYTPTICRYATACVGPV